MNIMLMSKQQINWLEKFFFLKMEFIMKSFSKKSCRLKLSVLMTIVLFLNSNCKEIWNNTLYKSIEIFTNSLYFDNGYILKLCIKKCSKNLIKFFSFKNVRDTKKYKK